MNNTKTIKKFKNRTEAGKQLAEKLLAYRSKNTTVLALPRGGVPVGYEVAGVLMCTLDTVVARKIGAPNNPELGLGAIAPPDILTLDKEVIFSLGFQPHNLDPIIEKETEEMNRRISLYKSGEYAKNLKSSTIVIVDDGLATGVTARAAIESVKKVQKPQTLILALPICARDTAETARALVDEVVCVTELDDLLSIGYWYEEFEQTEDREVIDLLEEANTNRAV